MKRRYEVLWTVRNAYDEVKRMRTTRAVLLFGFVAVMLFWFFFALESVLALINQGISGFLAGLLGVETPATNAWTRFLGALLELVGPLLVLVPLFGWMWHRYRGERRVKVRANLLAPDPHEGLIVLLSPYRLRVRADVAQRLGVPEHVAALRVLLESEQEGARADLRRQLFATTWGTLYAAVEHHRRSLRHCWLVCTAGEGGTITEATVAERLIQVAAAHPVACYSEGFSVPDGNDVSQVVPVIDRIYRMAAPAVNLEEDQVIADFTGATKAMTAGMIIATMDQRRKIEYLRQDRPLLVGAPDQLRALAPEEIAVEKILMMAETTRTLVPPGAEED